MKMFLPKICCALVFLTGGLRGYSSDILYGRTHAYRAAGWSEEVFKGGIVEMPAPAGISTIKVKPSDTKYYDLQGRPVTRPEKGRIYIHDGRKVVER